ncbi:Uncharacterized protein dnm_090520 [Desulfonema magnum]|uniref:Uncharacterized protein n=1 Tax=Desulfonema magnum TaxID=45655 RepID=A0A975BWE1_9BACT|nr:Uncharacterized protein dnm_090520 [Desulfonema magnum]
MNHAKQTAFHFLIMKKSEKIKLFKASFKKIISLHRKKIRLPGLPF